MSPSDVLELNEPNHSQTNNGGQELADAASNDSPPPDAVAVEDVPPNGGYGWVCTACVFLINAHTWGLNSVSAAREEDRAFT
jgi:hypothetical protein